MDVWHFCPSPVDFSREQGGVSNVVRALATETAGMGVTTRIVCGDHELGRRTQDAGRASPLPNLEIVTLRQRSNPALGPTGEIGRIVARIPWGDVAHVHTCFSAFTDYAMYSLSRHATPFVFSAHGKLSRAALRNRAVSKRLWWETVSKPRARSALRVGAASRAEADDAREAGLDAPAAVIPNGYSPFADLDPATAEPLISGPYVLFLGYLDPRKRPELLVEAFARSRFRYRAQLVVAGPDVYGFGTALRGVAGRNGIGERVLFYGPAYGAEKWSLLAHATCLCLPSRAEGMPLVVLEAIGAATPVIVSTECNAGAIVAAGAGIEIGEASAAAWSEAIDLLLSADDVREKMKRSAARIRPAYTWSAIAPRWLEIYRTISAEADESIAPSRRFARTGSDGPGRSRRTREPTGS